MRSPRATEFRSEKITNLMALNIERQNLALEFVRVTEAAALAAVQWVGKGDRKAADQAATDAMRQTFNTIDFKGLIVSGEGKKDEAPQLYEGEQVGNGNGAEVDLAVDPLECTDSVANGRPNAASVIAAGPRKSFLQAPDIYMEKIAVGPQAVGSIDINASVAENIKNVAKALNKGPEEVTVVVLDRPRHEELIKQIRQTGARVYLITDGDVAGAIATALPESPIDMLLGIGGAVEGVQSAIALKCLGGELQARFKPKNADQEQELTSAGLDPKLPKLNMSDLVLSDEIMFVATGVIDGPLLKGITFDHGAPITHSIVIENQTKTMRFIETRYWR